MRAKNITVEYVADLHARIERGESPKKINELSPKEFIREMLPHVKKFLAQGYTHKEIALFLGYISSGDLKKAVAKESLASATATTPKAKQVEKTTVAPVSLKKGKAGKASE